MAILSEHLSRDEIVALIEKAKKAVENGGAYLHYRSSTDLYRVIGLGIIEATQKVGVIYQKEYGAEDWRAVTWIRPISSWLEIIEIAGRKVQRFQKIGK